MEVKTIFTKRWFAFFFLMFIVWYPVTLLLITMYSILQHPIFLFAGNVFTPLWVLLVSYLYFRKAQDDWPARFVTAFGWMVLFFLFSAILVQSNLFLVCFDTRKIIFPVHQDKWRRIFQDR